MSTYIGNKGGQGIREFLINRVPKSNNYYSLFYGGGGFENSVLMLNTKWVCSEINPSNIKYQTKLCQILYKDYRSLIADNNFTRDDFIFADPPYLFDNRLSKSVYYSFEFSIADHLIFLKIVNSIKAKVLITHPKNNLYDKHLKGWYNLKFSYMSRAGWIEDSIYCNYIPSKTELLNYECIGDNSTHRQQIKRKRNNIVKKINSLSFHEIMSIKRELFCTFEI